MLSLGTPNEKLHKRVTKVTGLARAASTSRLQQQKHVAGNISPSISGVGNPSEFACLPKSCVSFNQLYPLDIARYQNQYGMQPCPLVIAGPSGSGKSTLLKRLMEEFQDCFGFSVSHTTRSPRNGEEHGREYFFVPHHEFENCIQHEEFIEFTRFSNNYYGTSKKAVLDVLSSGKICILDVEMDGVKNLKKTHLNPRFVFIKPPSMEVLEDRLRSRGTENDESLRRRLDRAIEEMRFGESEGMFDLVITNDHLDTAYESLRSFIVEDIEALKRTRAL